MSGPIEATAPLTLWLCTLPVINQMDTSQAHLSNKGSVKELAKPDNLSKDELTAVLKYGAQKMSVLALPFDHVVLLC